MMIRKKMIIAFTIITAVTALCISVVVSFVIHREFDNYVDAYSKTRLNQWDMIFTNYYTRFGSWEGAETLIFQQRPMMQGRGYLHQGSPMSTSEDNERIIVVNAHHTVIADSLFSLTGQRYSHPEKATLSRNIMIDGSQVGTIYLNVDAPSTIKSLESTFLTSVNRNVIWTGIGSMIIAISLGILFASRLSKPLKNLTFASEKIAYGDFNHKVPVTTKDEIGKLAEAFNQMVNNLEHQDYLRRSLVADVAHELRTPLSIIRGNLELILSGVEEAQEAQIASIYDEALRMSYLIRDLQELSLAEAGQLKLNIKNVDLTGIINKIIFAFQVEADNKHIQIHFEKDDNIPTLTLDPLRIEQVLANLISNAIRYSPNEEHIFIKLHHINSQFINIQVIDHGPGIPTEDLPNIFERFYRGDKARLRDTGGTGLGLAISKEFIELHGGTIRAKNNATRGSTFDIHIPIRNKDTM